MASHCESWSHHVPPRLLGVPNLRTNRQRGHPRCQRRHGHRWRLRDHPRWIEAAFGWHWANVTRYNSKILQGSRVFRFKNCKKISINKSPLMDQVFTYTVIREHTYWFGRASLHIFSERLVWLKPGITHTVPHAPSSSKTVKIVKIHKKAWSISIPN